MADNSKAFPFGFDIPEDYSRVTIHWPGGETRTLSRGESLTLDMPDGSAFVFLFKGPPAPRRGCARDTDGDGNCPIHPNGCNAPAESLR